MWNSGMKIVMALALLAGVLPLRANIGDDLATLRSHYGSAKDMGGQLIFEVRFVKGAEGGYTIVPARDAANAKEHFTITVYFDGDRSGMEVFARNTSDPVKAALTQGDIDTILSAIGNGMPWSPFTEQNGKEAWLWGDAVGAPPKLLARYEAQKGAKDDTGAVLIVMRYTKK